jgi:hypothetical protein
MLARMAWPARLRAEGGRWLGVDTLDTVYLVGRPDALASPAASVAAGTDALRAKVERRRRLVVARRAATVLLVGAALLEGLALAFGARSVSLWLLPAVVPALVVLGAGRQGRATRPAAARLLDRDLHLGAVVATAFELESRAARSSNPTESLLAAAAVADGRRALGENLASIRVRLRSSGVEWAALAVVAAVVVAISLVAHASGGRSAALGPGGRSAAAAGGPGGTARVQHRTGPTLGGFTQTTVHAPPLPSITTGSPGSGAPSARNPYDKGVGNNGTATSPQPSSTGGASTTIESTRPEPSAGAAAAAAAGRGGASVQGSSLGSTSTSGAVPGLAPVGAAGSTTAASGGLSPLGSPGSGSASRTGSASGSGRGAAAGAGGSKGAGSTRGTPGGATAGGARGTTQNRAALVPQLRGGSRLPIQPGYVAVRGARGGAGTSSTPGAGGAGARGAQVDAQGGGGGNGLAYVPPGDSTVQAGLRGLLLGYFGSSLSLKFSGW